MAFLDSRRQRGAVWRNRGEEGRVASLRLTDEENGPREAVVVRP